MCCEGLNQRVKRLSFVDVKLIKWATFFATIIVVKFFPQLLRINYLVLVIFMVLCAAKPVYVTWIKKS
ncbi:MAG: hypothetical protein KAS05_03695 [Candidatus Omnitrophica bacterium]|nr:hypothetical protein [Candidatus Omnitrophota bacterium]